VARDTYYEIMGVPPTASAAEIRARYRKLILRIHPDLDGPPALFRQVQEAYEVLSDPARRASYDRLLETSWRAARAQLGPNRRQHPQPNPAASPRNVQKGPMDSHRATSDAGRQNFAGRRAVVPLLSRHPSVTLAMAGAILLVLGAALAGVGIALIVLGSVTLIIAALAALGSRGAKERKAYQRSGMAAVDAMSDRRFEVLLEYFFANKGYRVARIGGRGDVRAGLLLNDADGRTIVQVRRWNSVVRRDAVHHAVAAMAHYGAARALVVTSSDYSLDAVTVANSSGVTLWNRADLAAELTAFRGARAQSWMERLSSELRAGSGICLGFLAAIFVALMAVPTRQGGPSSATRAVRGDGK
jgi:HJR/Mrr/RecB family endonuclease